MSGSWPETGPLSSGGKPDSPTVPDTVKASSAPDFQKRYGFPKKDGYSLSYWLRGVQNDPLLDHRTTTELPVSADIVIIGSGVGVAHQAVSWARC